MAIINIVTNLLGTSQVLGGLAQIKTSILGVGTAYQGATHAIQGSLGGLRGSYIALAGAAGGLTSIIAGNSFVQAASEVENLEIRMRALTGSAADAQKAFQEVRKFAAIQPFTLQEVSQGAASLLAVTKDVGELNRLLEITGDIAVASNLDFQTTAQQLQRTFSAGINSADLFRERAVRAMLGFQAGVEVSAKESKEHIMKMWDEGTASIVGKSKELADKFSGIMSMLSDDWNQFQVGVMEGEPFKFIKIVMTDLHKFFAASLPDAIRDTNSALREFIEYILDSVEELGRIILAFENLGAYAPRIINHVIVLINKLADSFAEVKAQIKETLAELVSGVAQVVEFFNDKASFGLFAMASRFLDDAARIRRENAAGEPLIKLLEEPDISTTNSILEWVESIRSRLTSVAMSTRGGFAGAMQGLKKDAAGTPLDPEAAKAAAARLKELQSFIKGLNEEGMQPFEKFTRDSRMLDAALKDNVIKLEDYERLMVIINERYDEAQDKLEEFVNTLREDAKTETEKYIEQLEMLDQAFKAGIIPSMEEYIKLTDFVNAQQKKGQEQTEALTAEQEVWINFAQSQFQTLGDTISAAFEEGKISGDTFKDVLRSIITDMIKMVVQLGIINPLLNAMFGNIKNFTNLPTLFGGGGGEQGSGVLGTVFSIFGSLASSIFGSYAGTTGLFGANPMQAGSGFVPPVKPFASGGSGFFTRPTLLSVAEMGPERVDVSPFGSHAKRSGDVFIIDARGADRAEFKRLERMIFAVDASVEERSVTATTQEVRIGGRRSDILRS